MRGERTCCVCGEPIWGAYTLESRVDHNGSYWVCTHDPRYMTTDKELLENEDSRFNNAKVVTPIKEKDPT
jgi:hypothetical protein